MSLGLKKLLFILRGYIIPDVTFSKLNFGVILRLQFFVFTCSSHLSQEKNMATNLYHGTIQPAAERKPI